MRIAVWHNLPSGGGKRALYDHVKGLVARGHEVESWCPPSADQTYLPLSGLCEEHVVPLNERRPWPWLKSGRSIVDYSEMLQRLEAMDLHCHECAKQITAKKFDILFANSCLLFRVSPIAKHLSIPKALYLQEPFRWLYEALPTYPWALPTYDGSRLLRPLRQLADFLKIQSLRLQVRDEIANASRFDQILVNSCFSRESVGRAYGIEANVCYLGVDCDRFRPTGEAKEDFVVGLGGLTYAKGPDRTLRALAQVPQRDRPRLIWVANFAGQEYKEEIKSLAENLKVVFELRVGISDEELVSVLSRARMALYTPRLEPFGYAPLEANACGTPVIAVAEGGVRETVKHGTNGFLVEGDLPEVMGKMIADLSREPSHADEIGRSALAYVRRDWSISSAIDRLENALLAIAQTRRLAQ